MPTTSLTLNGVHYTDTVNFLAEFTRVNDEYLDKLLQRLYEYAELEDEGPDMFERFPMWEVVRNPDVDFCCKKRCDSGGHSVHYKKHISKSKVVK